MRPGFFFLTSLLCFGILTPGLGEAVPRTKTGACRAPLPTSTRKLEQRRYRVYYPRTLYGLLKFYRKLFGSRNPNYRVTKLFALSHVVAYHLRNLRPHASWKGLNLVYYRRKEQLQIFVLCK